MLNKQAKQRYDHARYLRLKKVRDDAKPPHPIAQLRKEERAYIAGLIDGEGAIYCARTRGRTWHPTISINMTHEGVLRWLSQKVGGQKVHSTVRHDVGHYYKSVLKTQYLFRTSGRVAQMLCRALLPYLKVKANHARVVCAFPVDARAGRRLIRGSLTNEQRHRLALQLEALNENRYRRRHLEK